MTQLTQTPLSLHKANLELQAKLVKLLQESGRQWLDFVQRLVDEGIVESDAKLKAVLDSGDWQTLATLPGDSFWRQLQQRFDDSQVAVQIATSAQSGFVSGLQEAIGTWQKETVAALSGIPSAPGDAGSVLTDLFRPWRNWMSTFAPSADFTRPEPGRRKK